jgi:cytochrome c oxidase subunit III
LVISGISITWAHRSVALGSYLNLIDSLLITIVLGFLFVLFQMVEYYESSFNFDDSVYSNTFFMLTGLHGCHVIVESLLFLFAL